MSSASELFAQSSSFHRQPARGDARREAVWTFASLHAHSGLAQIFSVRGRIKIPMQAVFAAPENDARRLAYGQLVRRAGRERDVLAADAEFPP